MSLTVRLIEKFPSSMAFFSKDCRYDVAPVDVDVEPAGEIGRFEPSPMRVAELALSGGIEFEMRVIDWLYKTWLPRSGFAPDDQPAFEAWIRDASRELPSGAGRSKWQITVMCGRILS